MSKEIGSMNVILHRERSFHNVDIRILKSALQKYARRGMFTPKGLWCLIELDLFSLLENHPNLMMNCQLTNKQIEGNVKRIRSNMINRLIAMMSEDVGPCYIDLPRRIHQFYLKWIQSRKESSSRVILLRIYHSIANEKIVRIRLLSDLRTVYFLPEYLTEKKDLHRQLLDKYQMEEVKEIIYGNTCRGKKVKFSFDDLEKRFVFFLERSNLSNNDRTFIEEIRIILRVSFRVISTK